MKSKSHKLLFEAFEKLNVSLLREAVTQGEELNIVYETEAGFNPFWLNDAFSRFLLQPDEWNSSATIEIWKKEKKQIKEILKEAVDLGMDANLIYDEHGGGYMRTLSLLMYIPEDLEFVDFLISLGFNPCQTYGEPYTAFEELESLIEPRPSEDIEYQAWLRKLYEHLRDEFNAP